MESESAGQVASLIDDSIVRGTTSREIVHMAIDFASPTELIAHGKTRQEVARHINANEVIYQDIEDLKLACTKTSPESLIKDFEVGFFNRQYQTEVPEGYVDPLGELRGNKRKLPVVEDGLPL
ncbi:hypothetical protein G7Z17_g13589 [Cylindrodendrum hubeiense]|uniref:Uncharacterized protein n=1 Tax=Cylindrodendrum hubeiense TaxID=595255 RepID=A0A9P5H0Q8_9HYPO|nr:hypothetical protein G7Z17_g13589 [Cylindrodendrum hubeiense]